VSLSWRDGFVAVIAPDRVVLVRRPRGWRKAAVLQGEAACAAPTAQAAADALRSLLARPESGRGPLTVLVSSHFVQFLLVPWRAEVGAPGELNAYATVCFDETFGEASGRALRMARERTPSARIGAALDAGFLASVRAAVATSRMTLVSVQPYAAAVFNRARRALPRRNFMLVVAEPGRSCVLLAGDRGWRSLRNAAGRAAPRELAQLVEREAQLAGLTEPEMPPVFLHVPGQESLELPPCLGMPPKMVPCGAGAGAADPLLAMALAVA